MWRIKQGLIEDLIQISKNNYPKESMVFIGEKNGVISEIIFLPSTTGENFASINLGVIPINSGILGSFHSHPFGTAHPSEADKKFFQKYEINLILSLNNKEIKAYNSKSEEINFEIEE